MRKQAGFTLIELVMVIVILGILAATALPRFANLQVDARQASRDGVAGGVRAAAAIAHAEALLRNATTDVTLEGATVQLDNGYPDEVGIVVAAQIDGITPTTAGTTVTWQIDGLATCTVTYTAAAANAAPVIGGNDTCI